jgi:hypothetical protein
MTELAEDEIEQLCRVICIAENVDPDRESLGCGGVIPRDQKYKLWEARRQQAAAIFAAGYRWGTDDQRKERAGWIHTGACNGCAHEIWMPRSMLP